MNPPKYDAGPCIAPGDARYGDPRDLEAELRRVFAVCSDCRLCVNHCPSFPELFRRVDGYEARGLGGVLALHDQDYAAVDDLCFQCKLCYVKCPYTADDGHALAIDFPRLMLRHRAQRAKRYGVTLQDRVLGEPQVIGMLGSGPQAPMANLVTTSRLLRKVQASITGISAEFNLPPFASQSLYKWWKEHTRSVSAGSAGDVVLFSTCTTNYHLPSAGQAAIQVLEHNGFAVHFPKEQTCCGMPNLDGGDTEAAVRKAQCNVATLLPHARVGRPIVVMQPTCGMMLKKEYPGLLGTEEARLVAASTFDFMEFIGGLHDRRQLKREFKRSLGTVAYHAPCHIRAQGMGMPAAEVLATVPSTQVVPVEECSAVDGTWGMKTQHYDLGRTYAEKLVRGVAAVPYDVVATDCALSGLRLAQEMGVAALHPAELLNDAYGLAPVRPGEAAGKPLA